MQEPTTNDLTSQSDGSWGLYCKAQPDLPNEDAKERDGDPKNQIRSPNSDNKPDDPVPFPVPEVDPT